MSDRSRKPLALDLIIERSCVACLKYMLRETNVSFMVHTFITLYFRHWLLHALRNFSSAEGASSGGSLQHVARLHLHLSLGVVYASCSISCSAADKGMFAVSRRPQRHVYMCIYMDAMRLRSQKMS